MSGKINKVDRITLGGGLIGALTTNTKSAFQKNIQENNAEGWSLCHVEPIGGTNLFMLLVRMILLVITLTLFTLGASYIMVYEKDR